MNTPQMPYKPHHSLVNPFSNSERPCGFPRDGCCSMMPRVWHESARFKNVCDRKHPMDEMQNSLAAKLQLHHISMVTQSSRSRQKAKYSFPACACKGFSRGQDFFNHTLSTQDCHLCTAASGASEDGDSSLATPFPDEPFRERTVHMSSCLKYLEQSCINSVDMGMYIPSG